MKLTTCTLCNHFVALELSTGKRNKTPICLRCFKAMDANKRIVLEEKREN